MSKAFINTPGPIFREPLYSLQAGRAFAAMAVLLLHADRIIGSAEYGAVNFAHFWFSSGRLGVDFFFALSGFIILHAHARDIDKPARLSRYLQRRAQRIYPIYWIILSFAIMGLLLAGHRLGIMELVSNYSLLDPYERPRLVTVAWTLFHESLFYLVFATLILNRWLGGIVFAAWLLAVIWFQGHSGAPEVITGRINLCFGAGMLACVCAHKLPARAFPWPLIIGIGGLSYLVWATHAAALENAPEGAPAALFCGLVIMGLAMADKAKAWNVPEPLVFLGAASYSIYLFQFAALSAAGDALVLVGGMRLLSPAVVVGFLVAFGMAAGSVFYWLIERPILQKARAKALAA